MIFFTSVCFRLIESPPWNRWNVYVVPFSPGLSREKISPVGARSIR